MDVHTRKIDLQAPADLTYLRDNIDAAAQRSLDLLLPPNVGPAHAQDDEDALRRQVQDLVHAYVRRTLTLALPSISVNGLEAAPALLAHATANEDTQGERPPPEDPNDPSYEPYDPQLATRLRELYAALETETTQIAALRREAPAQAAAAWLQGLKDDVATTEAAFIRQRAEISADEDAIASLDSLAAAISTERTTETATTLERGRQQLEQLQGLTEVVARLERAQQALGEARLT